MSKNRESHDNSVFASLLKITAPHKRWILFSLLLSFAATVFSLLLTFFTQQLVTRTVHSDFSLNAVWFFLLFVLASSITGGLSIISSSRLGAYTGRDLKRSVSKKMMEADYRLVQDISSGNAISIMNNDCKQVTTFLSNDLFSLITQLLTAVCAFGYLLLLNPELAILSFAYTPIGMVLAGRINRKMNALYPILSELKGEALTGVEQVLHSLPVIKSFGMERNRLSKLELIYKHLFNTEKQIKLWESMLQPACLAIANSPTIVFTIVGGLFALSGRLKLGEFVAILQLLGYIIPPTVMLPFMLNNLNRSGASIHRINSILNLPTVNSKDPQMKSVFTPAHCCVDVENLSFKYHSSSAVLKNISFTVNKPGIIAIVGGSGSGKSTLLTLISGLYHPNSGSISINGQNTSQMSESELVQWLSVMPQDIHLFNTSIFDNLRVGKEGADEHELIAVSKETGLHAYAIHKDKGYETTLGDGGGALSGGQAQKLGLARAYLKNAPIWLLDEPTSAMDEASETGFTKLITEIATSRIVFIAAHRIPTIQMADRIIFLHNGIISGDGSWKQLSQNDEFLKSIHLTNKSAGSREIQV